MQHRKNQQSHKNFSAKFHWYFEVSVLLRGSRLLMFFIFISVIKEKQPFHVATKTKLFQCLFRARSSLTFRQLWSVDSLWNAYVTWQEHTIIFNAYGQSHSHRKSFLGFLITQWRIDTKTQVILFNQWDTKNRWQVKGGYKISKERGR